MAYVLRLFFLWSLSFKIWVTGCFMWRKVFFESRFRRGPLVFVTFMQSRIQLKTIPERWHCLRWNFSTFNLRYNFSIFSIVYICIGINQDCLWLRWTFFKINFFCDHWLVRKYFINVMINWSVCRVCSYNQIESKIQLRNKMLIWVNIRFLGWKF